MRTQQSAPSGSDSSSASKNLWLASVLAVLAAPACHDSNQPFRPGPQPAPTPGQTAFVSADGQNGQASQGDEAANRDTAAPPEAVPDAATGEQARSVEEGDIYRVLSGTSQILNLNRYRGLQIIDFSNSAQPEIVGRVAISGTPVEMYAVGDRVYMLLNNWHGYYGTRQDIRPQVFEGGVVVAVDVSDVTAPRVTGRAPVDGYIRTSRLTRGGGQEALYVVTGNGDETHVKSFTVSAQGALLPRTEIDLGGYVTDIQATSDRLLVARHVYSQTQHGSDVAVIDISNANGTMVEGASVRVEGLVQNKYNMDVHGDILRVVSANTWRSASNTNHLQTFDVSDIQNPIPVDHDTFGDTENLFATIFMADRAFFVTYRRVDPFHAFSISPTGQAQEMSEFIVSGWNDFFRPVSNGSRLIGIGKNDENGVTLAVSLYDITDLSNPTPLITRDEIDLDWSWSEANWDDRAFSVLEGATSAVAADGTQETGLVLLPFSGWDDQNNQYLSGVQIFTFSDTTLTKRGVMDHATPVRRSFMADASNGTTGNLSEVELSLFDTNQPDNPVEMSRLELAPNYTSFLAYGNHGVRRKSQNHYSYYWGGRGVVVDDELEVVALSGDVDTADAVATINVPVNASIYKVGDKLAAVTTEIIDWGGENSNRVVETTVEVYDLSQPATPTYVGALTTRDLPLTWSYGGWWGYADCFNCGYWGGQANLQVVDDGLVFVEPHQERQLEGSETTRYIRPVNDRWSAGCWNRATGESEACTYHTGGISCRTLARVDGTTQPEVCQGEIFSCVQDASGETQCTEVQDLSQVQTQQDTHTYDRYRYWQHYDFHSVDLSGVPQIGDVVTMAQNEEAVGLLSQGSHLYVTYKRPHRVAGDARSFVRYFFRDIDWANPQSAASGASINIPGELIAVDGSTLLTRDTLWGSSIVETSLNKLELVGSRAHLRGVRRFPNQLVQQVLLDGSGHVLVSHRAPWNYGYGYGVPVHAEVADSVVGRRSTSNDPGQQLSIVDLASNPLPMLATMDVDSWANLTSAIAGRALFTVPGGLLVVNLDAPAQPYAQAYFPMQGWPRNIEVDGRDAYMAAGRFGLYTVDLDAFNLLTPAP